MSLRAGRRAVLKSGLCLGLGLRMAPSALALGQQAPSAVRPKEGDRLVKVDDPTQKPLAPADLPLGATQTMAWAMDPAEQIVRSGSRLNRVILLRLDADGLSPDTKAIAADGVVAYTAICTHSGCEVADWLADEQVLYCPCHSSKFDPKDGAKVVDGPAPRNLPALPLKLVDGLLVVARPFTARVGFDVA